MDGLGLSAAFDMDEITSALFSMDMNSSPGPDGFGPSFYKAFWPQLKHHIASLFTDFHAGALDLDGLNRTTLSCFPRRTGCALQTASDQSPYKNVR